MSLIGKRRATSTGEPLTLVNTTDSIITLAGPVTIYRVGIHAAVAKTTGTALVITVQSVAGVTESALGTVTSPDTFVAGNNLAKSFNPPLTVAAGAYAKLEITTGAGGGAPTGKVWVEYTDEPLTQAWLDTVIALT